MAIGEAIAAFHAGRHAEAASVCRRVLAAQPDNPDEEHEKANGKANNKGKSAHRAEFDNANTKLCHNNRDDSDDNGNRRARARLNGAFDVHRQC